MLGGRFQPGPGQAAASTADDPVKVGNRSATLSADPKVVAVPVGRRGDTSEAVSFRYRTQAGSAAAGTGFVAVEGPAAIAPGAKAVAVPVTVLGQTADQREPGKFSVQIDRVIATSGPIDALRFASDRTGAVPGNLWAMASADFNADGKLDLASANTGTGKLDIFANTTATPGAPTTFAPALGLAHVSAPDKPTVCDLNQDGLPDYVTGGFVASAVPLRIQRHQREFRVLVPADPSGTVSLKP